MGSAGQGVAFLIAQVGARAAGRFAERVGQLGLTPPEVALLRMIGGAPGSSQQAVAAGMGVVPSRVVAILDTLDRKGLVERRQGVTDRRHHALHLTDGGRRLLAELRRLDRVHDDDLCAALDPQERTQLAGLLQRIADQQGLTAGAHPGHRQPRARRRR